MIQDIYPHKLDNSYRNREIKAEDILFVFDKEGRMLLNNNEGSLALPGGMEFPDHKAKYLFSVDKDSYFMAEGKAECEYPGYGSYTIREIRDILSGVEVYAAFTAYHLWKWYSDNRFCGKCAGGLIHDEKERALKCPACKNMIYPRINPAVIAGVTKGDSMLITKYRRGYGHSALVAGFTEIGETLEETVAREVMEETGIRVKNIRYYKSQPWGMAQDILVGFYCEADGDAEIHMDENELKYADWVKREDIELQPNNLSLTNEMMKMFKEGNYNI